MQKSKERQNKIQGQFTNHFKIKFKINEQIYLQTGNLMCMVRTKLTDEEKEKQKEEQKVRAKASRAARRSGKSIKREGKVDKAKAKTKETRSQKKIATVNKSRQ